MRSAIRLLGFAVICLAGCSGDSSPDAEPQSEIAAQERLWREAGLESYRFEFQQQCFCVPEQVQPVTVEVLDGRIERVISSDTGQDLSGEPNLQWYTVSDLFNLISEARGNDTEPLVVRYDPQLGYPTYIEIGSLAADAGAIYSASNLEPL
jgi:hypothetical protein